MPRLPSWILPHCSDGLKRSRLASGIITVIPQANTAREITLASSFDKTLLELVCRRAQAAANSKAPSLQVEFLVADYSGNIVSSQPLNAPWQHFFFPICKNYANIPISLRHVPEVVMPQFFEGKLEAKGLRFGIIVSRFNSFISERLLEGAVDALVRHGGRRQKYPCCPGAGRIRDPAGGQETMAESGKYDAVICLGAVIRGSTPHFDYVASEVSKGVATVSLDSGVPIAFGVLTTDTIEQAVERAGTKAGNKGFEAAVTAIETVNLLKALK